MRRADRLFAIIQLLRGTRRPMTAEAIAQALETSRRTVYRDIATLMAERVPIRGEAGIGYVLARGYDLAPLMLTSDEVEAVVLGAQWVRVNGDEGLAEAAAGVLAKVAAIVPDALRAAIEEPAVTPSPLWVERGDAAVDVGGLRAAALQGRKLRLHYADEAGRLTERTVWPFLIGYREGVRVVFAWCELRAGFRMFRTDRLRHAAALAERYPEPRASLRRRWEAAMALERRADGWPAGVQPRSEAQAVSMAPSHAPAPTPALAPSTAQAKSTKAETPS